MTREHPYKAFEDTDVWDVLSRALENLEENGDIEKTTAMPYIVGYLAERLVEAGVVVTPSTITAPSPAKKARRKAQ